MIRNPVVKDRNRQRDNGSDPAVKETGIVKKTEK